MARSIPRKRSRSVPKGENIPNIRIICMNDCFTIICKNEIPSSPRAKTHKNLFLEFSSYFMSSLNISSKLHFCENYKLYFRKKRLAYAKKLMLIGSDLCK